MIRASRVQDRGEEPRAGATGRDRPRRACAFRPYAFASEYGIPVVQLSDLDGVARDYFLRADGSALSGALIPNGSGVVILENDAQPLTRRRTTMCHELAHVVLEHQFGVSLSDERKCGLGGDQEAEADWLSGRC